MYVTTHTAHDLHAEAYKTYELAKELWDITQKRKELAPQEFKIKKALISMAHNKTLMLGEFAFIKELRRGGISYSEIPELFSIDLEQYRKEDVEVWKLIKTS